MHACWCLVALRPCARQDRGNDGGGGGGGNLQRMHVVSKTYMSSLRQSSPTLQIGPDLVGVGRESPVNFAVEVGIAVGNEIHILSLAELASPTLVCCFLLPVTQKPPVQAEASDAMRMRAVEAFMQDLIGCQQILPCCKQSLLEYQLAHLHYSGDVYLPAQIVLQLDILQINSDMRQAKKTIVALVQREAPA